ncbi:MAG: GspE/PulE family protein [Deltaproteobacteria bacterium]|jgi:type IV pilus assembly protein PilB|nr:GspE/PulE family protein [Deltaproteobacteria bacterium]
MQENNNLIPLSDDICNYSAKNWRELALCSTPEARKILPYETASALCVLPLNIVRDNERQILVAIIPDGSDDNFLKQLTFACGMQIQSEYANVEDLQKAIFLAYRGSQVLLDKAVLDVPNNIVSPKNKFEIPLNSPIPNLLNALLERAINLSASDIHLEATKDTYRVRFRVHGYLFEEDKLKLNKLSGDQLISRIKVLTKLNTTKTHECLEGAFSFENSAWSVRLRVSIIPTFFGEKVVLRLLDNRFLDELRAYSNSDIFYQLGFSNDGANQLKFHLGANDGLIITTGPTGSGKSTLLYACLEYLNNASKNIVTIEDPVERIIAGVNQIEISEKDGMTAENLLTSILRQDPDILLVGEIRTPDVAKTALVAGITGHLVLTSLHATNCLEVLNRFGQFKLDKQLIASGVRLIISQRLLAKNCPYCIENAEISAAGRKLLNIPEEVVLKKSRGCQFCSGTGLSGRIAVFEQLSFNERLQLAITNEPTAKNSKGYLSNLKQVAIENGYVSLVFAIRDELLKGSVSPQVALAALGLNTELLL